jgi:DNA-binding LytR/AlgR family response regulator
MTHVRVAWIEDSDTEIEEEKAFLLQFSKSHDVDFHVTFYETAEAFLAHYDYSFDLVLMDIDLPGINGMEASQRLRKIDKEVVLMFITNISKLASKGYEVNALSDNVSKDQADSTKIAAPSTKDVTISGKAVGLWEWMANQSL